VLLNIVYKSRCAADIVKYLLDIWKKNKISSLIMHSVNKDMAIKMVEAIRMLIKETKIFLEESGKKPASSSVAESEIRTFSHPKSVKTAYGQGNILIEVVADHLMAFTRTVTEPVMAMAPWTCIRGCLEASALACWLFDPAIDAQRRVRRSFAFRYEGFNQQAKFGSATGDSAARKKVQTQINKIRNKATEIGYSPVKDKNGHWIGVGEKMPNTTDLIRKTLDKEAIYRALSAIAHAHPWALQQLSFIKIDDRHTNMFEKSLHPVSVAFLCIEGFNCLTKPIKKQCQLFGWDKILLENIFSSVLEVFSADN